MLNPAAFTHYSYALRDAAAQLKQAGVPLVEVHLSNPAHPRAFRHTSVISGVATGVIAGFGSRLLPARDRLGRHERCDARRLEHRRTLDRGRARD